MKLTVDELRRIACGAEYITEEDGLVHFHRFTAEQEALYAKEKPKFLSKVYATAGVCLSFLTDSETLVLSAVATVGSTRTFFSVDVTVDGVLLDSLDNFTEAQLPPIYNKVDCPLGSFSKTFSLGKGEKTVKIHLPWSVCLALKDVTLDDGAMLVPVKPEKQLLVFGDSITQGYDALRPTRRYAAALADALGAEEYNKAIGGEQFYPALADTDEPFCPAYISVAYGTNDWCRTDVTTFMQRCRDLYGALRRRYPAAHILAISPIYRKDCDEEKGFAPFASIASYIEDAVSGISDVTCIRGSELVPEDNALFADGGLHPNDRGFACYIAGVRRALGKAGIL